MKIFLMTTLITEKNDNRKKNRLYFIIKLNMNKPLMYVKTYKLKDFLDFFQ